MIIPVSIRVFWAGVWRTMGDPEPTGGAGWGFNFGGTWGE
jgi:hypothetical protein